MPNLWLVIVTGLTIIGLEWSRRRPWFEIDFFRAISLVLFVVYVVIPLMVIVRPVSTGAGYLEFATTITSAVAAKTSCAALLAVCAMHGGRVIARLGAQRAPRLQKLLLLDWPWLAVIAFSAIVGAGFAAVYIRLSGMGPIDLIRFSGSLRTGTEATAVSFTFLNLGGMIQTAGLWLVAEGTSKRALPGRRLLYIAAGGALSLAACVILLMRGGRLYVLCFAAAYGVLLVNRIRRAAFTSACFGVGLLAIVLWVIYGNVIFGRTEAVNTAHKISEAADVIEGNLYFPFASTAMAVTVVPDQMGFRYFSDFFFGPVAAFSPIVDRIAVRLTGELLSEGLAQPTVAQVNSEFFLGSGAALTEIPVDIVAFGYYSLGFAGVVILAAAFGWLVEKLNQLTSAGRGFMEGWRSQLIIYMSSTALIYSDLRSALSDGYFIVLPSMLLVLAALARVKTQASGGPAVPKPART